MSTEMRPTSNLHLTQFWGGKERGICIQVTEKEPWNSACSTGYIRLKRHEALELAHALIAWFNEELPEG